MKTSSRRLAVAGAAVLVLAVAGIGLASAAGFPGGAATSTTTLPATSAGGPASAGSLDELAAFVAGDTTAGTTAPDARAGHEGRFARLLVRSRRLVHAVVTVDLPKKGLVTYQLDHGTISTIGNGTLTIAESGGGSVTVATTSTTKVRIRRTAGTLADLKGGQDVFVASTVSGGTSTAIGVVVLPAAATPAASPSH